MVGECLERKMGVDIISAIREKVSYPTARTRLSCYLPRACVKAVLLAENKDIYLTDEISTPHSVFEAAAVFFFSHFSFSLVHRTRVRAGGMDMNRGDTYSSP